VAVATAVVAAAAVALVGGMIASATDRLVAGAVVVDAVAAAAITAAMAVATTKVAVMAMPASVAAATAECIAVGTGTVDLVGYQPQSIRFGHPHTHLSVARTRSREIFGVSEFLKLAPRFGNRAKRPA